MRDRSPKDRSRRRRRHYDEYDDEPGGISGWKMGVVGGVIVVCFATLYPTLFHPMIMGFLGHKQQGGPSINQQRPPIHPAMGGGGPRHPGSHPGMRPDVHPAMKMAQAQAESQSGGGRGMFTYMLPIYTIGVVIFLLYTLFKPKNKKKRRRSDSMDDYSDSDVDEYGGGKRLGKRKLKGLQERLRQTEETMSKILDQLEQVQAAGHELTTLEGSKKPKEESSEQQQTAPLSEQSEQYIQDLEKALKDFKVLSKEYEKAKGGKTKKIKDDETSDSQDSEEEEGVMTSSSVEDESKAECEVEKTPEPTVEVKKKLQSSQGKARRRVKKI